MILEVKNISKNFSVSANQASLKKFNVAALDKISFQVDANDSLAIVGESGSGKTTLAKIILKLINASSGEIIYGNEISNLRKDMQIIFQNPYNSLNPKMRIGDILKEPLIIHKLMDKSAQTKRVYELLKIVGLEENILDRFPAEFSGGQRQRICIARALAVEPKVLILDEPISSLDLTIQAKILDLLKDLKQKFSLTYIFITHNLAVVKYLCNRVLVLKKGQIVEQGLVSEVLTNPTQEYTKNLLQSAK